MAMEVVDVNSGAADDERVRLDEIGDWNPTVERVGVSAPFNEQFAHTTA